MIYVVKVLKNEHHLIQVNILHKCTKNNLQPPTTKRGLKTYILHWRTVVITP
jgi:hypothetical protein